MENCPYGGAVIALGILFYRIQLYCDFSGGIDITRGVAHVRHQYDAQLPPTAVFHLAHRLRRRWHITLGAWMRDYAFYPLAFSKPFGKLGKWARKHFKGMMGKICATSTATFIVYLIIGIWHGANFRYIAFGLWNGILITASLLMERRFLSWKEKLAHQRQIDRLAHLYDRPHVRTGVYRPLFHPCTASQDRIHAARTTVLHPHFSEFMSVVPTFGLGIRLYHHFCCISSSTPAWSSLRNAARMCRRGSTSAWRSRAADRADRFARGPAAVRHFPCRIHLVRVHLQAILRRPSMNAKKWVLSLPVIVLIPAALLAGFNYVTDPFGAFGDRFMQWFSYDETNNPRAAKISYLEQHHDEYDSYFLAARPPARCRPNRLTRC